MQPCFDKSSDSALRPESIGRRGSGARPAHSARMRTALIGALECWARSGEGEEASIM